MLLPNMGVEDLLSCDLESLNIFSFPLTQEAPYDIWIKLAYWLLRIYLKLSRYDKSPKSRSQ